MPLRGSFKGAGWLLSSYALSKVVRVAMLLVVAALLSPQEYGVIGLSAVVITLAQVINEFGIWQAVVHRKDPDETFLNTAFAANLLGGLVTSGGTFLIAPIVANFYGEPGMAEMLRIMALALVLDAAFYVPDGLLRKRLEFRSRVLPEVAGTAGAAITTLVLILSGYGVVGYAVGFVVESGLRCALTLRRLPWRPGPRASWESLREIVSYAKHVQGASLTTYASSNVDYLVVGRMLGAGPLGLYTLAFNLANYPVSNLAQILSRITFPAFASLRDEPGGARRAYLQTIKLLAVVTVPALVMLALLATPLVAVGLGEEWLPAVFPLQAMVAVGISRAISIPGADVLRAVGLPRLLFGIGLTEGLVLLGVLLLVAPAGIEAVAVSVALVLGTGAWYTTTAACRALGVGFRELAGSLVPALSLTAAGAGAVLLLIPLGLGGPTPSVPGLVAQVVVAAAAMGLCLVTAQRGLLRELAGLVPGKGV